jgi:aspartate/methionine/tyrosine aminotransferase
LETLGVQQALYLVLRTLLQRGDEVLILSPYYANYYLDTVASGGQPVLVPLDEKAGFLPDVDLLEQAITPPNPQASTGLFSTSERCGPGLARAPGPFNPLVAADKDE